MDPFIYQYSIGGLVFFAGLYFAYRQGYVGFTGRSAISLAIMLGGLALFMGIQGYLQYAPMETAEAVPFEGSWERSETIGTGLDYGIMIAYFIAMVVIGTFFGRGQTTTRDFFMAGQRFSWWLIALSLVATTVGSYSFVKYSKVAYSYGLSSSQSYFNDWFWMPLLLFGWLPILYFRRLTSIPEYFDKRFGPLARQIVTWLLLVYLIGYVGINLYTMGTALNILLGWPVPVAAIVVGAVSAIYVTTGGQTSVIMTDLFQGAMLLATGLVILVLGIDYLGGFDNFWEHLPRDHRRAFSSFSDDSSFPAVGVFWQDGMANSAMFYLLNQGIMMRFMAAKSVNEGRKAAVFMPLVLMPLAAIAVASGGWVGKALSHAGVLPELEPGEAFFVASEFLSTPGVFGLIMAALTAALMSTVDTLITAVSAIVVNDVYKPQMVRKGIRAGLTAEDAAPTERSMMRVARLSSVGVTVLGLLLVPVFMTFDSIYEAHGAFTAAVTPPMVVALLCSVFWRRFTKAACVATLAGGAGAIFLSILFPVLVEPFSQGVPARELGEGVFAGAEQFKFTRAFFGLSVSAGIAVVVTLFTRPESEKRQRGLVWGTVADALRFYKGSDGAEIRQRPILATLDSLGADSFGANQLPHANLSVELAAAINASPGDLVYVSDARRWLGGLRSGHALVGEVFEAEGLSVRLGPQLYNAVASKARRDKPVRIERLY